MSPARALAGSLLAFAVLLPLTLPPSGAMAAAQEMVLAIYSVPKEAYEKRIIPAFRRHWQQRTGQDVRIRSSYGASGAQARAIIGGFEADVAALSVEGDLDQVAKAGLITHDWRRQPHRGMVTASVVVFGVRKGNPKGIKTWEDLAKPGVEILYPNPKTSGGAMWDVLALYGAGLTLAHNQPGIAPEARAATLLKHIQRNVKVMDKSGRESVTTFERGVGDVILTYESELLPRIQAGHPYELIVPAATILIENPAALVDRNVDRHGVRQVAEAFVAFLHGPEAQRAFADSGFRPVDRTAAPGAAAFPQPARLFTVGELGGWEKAAALLFGPRGIWTRTVEELARGK